MSEFKKYEDIYPLTIVKMRFGNKYVAFNAPSDAGFIWKVEGDEEIYYRLDSYLEESVSPCLYGVGKTIWEALDDLLARQKS